MGRTPQAMEQKDGEPRMSLALKQPNPVFDTKRHLVHLFNQEWEARFTTKNPLPFGGCMKAMKFFESVDEATGEIVTEFPDDETWLRELRGFWDNEFARVNRRYHFTYFLKQFGSFSNPVKKKIPDRPKARLRALCVDCKQNHFLDEECPKGV